MTPPLRGVGTPPNARRSGSKRWQQRRLGGIREAVSLTPTMDPSARSETRANGELDTNALRREEAKLSAATSSAGPATTMGGPLMAAIDTPPANDLTAVSTAASGANTAAMPPSGETASACCARRSALRVFKAEHTGDARGDVFYAVAGDDRRPDTPRQPQLGERKFGANSAAANAV
jgi:hypothetical protein